MRNARIGAFRSCCLPSGTKRSNVPLGVIVHLLKIDQAQCPWEVVDETVKQELPDPTRFKPFLSAYYSVSVTLESEPRHS